MADKGVKLILLHPGWVKTDLGGLDAEIDAHTSVKGMLEVIKKNQAQSHAEVLRSYTEELIAW